MRKILLLWWLLGLLPAAAQTRAAGPWRVARTPIRYRLSSDWGGAEWGETLAPTAKVDTTTAVRVQRKLFRVPWNVHPDSITLFLGCQNPFLAPAAPHGQLAPIRFRATGATVRLEAKQQLLLLVPSDSVVVLWAYRGQKLAFRHEFRAGPPPLPAIKCYTGGSYANICKGTYEARKYIRSITLRALPDADFAEVLPDDARYRVARFRLVLLRQAQVVELAPSQPAEKIVQGPQSDLSDLAGVAQPGDQLQTDVLAVQRMNFRGIIMEVPAKRRFIADGPRCPEQE